MNSEQKKRRNKVITRKGWTVRYLSNAHRPALRGPYGTEVQGDPVDLVFENGCDRSVLLRTDPHVPFGPYGQLPDLQDFGVGVRNLVLHGEPAGVEDAHVTSWERRGSSFKPVLFKL
jgi:hypothetical protein